MSLRLLVIAALFVISLGALQPVLPPLDGVSWTVSEPLRTDFPFQPGLKLVLNVDVEAVVHREVSRDVYWVQRLASEHGVEVHAVSTHGIGGLRVESPEPYERIREFFREHVRVYGYSARKGDAYIFHMLDHHQQALIRGAMRTTVGTIRHRTGADCNEETSVEQTSPRQITVRMASGPPSPDSPCEPTRRDFSPY